MQSLDPMLSDILSLPESQIGYEFGRRLREAFPDKELLEVEIWSYRPLEYAQEGHCRCVPHPGIHQQSLANNHEDNELKYSAGTSWYHIEWNDHEIEQVRLRWIEGEYATDRDFLLVPEREVGEAFVLEVCEWYEEVREEVLVFHDGHWSKDESLYEAIQGVSFDDIVLPESLLGELRRDVDGFFSCEEQYNHYKLPWKRGVLLHGPPGNGKTHVIKAILNSANKPRLYVKSFQSDCMTQEECIRLVFERAREVAPCILLLEDLDSLINDDNRSFFLNEMDGFASNHGILTLATTNHVEDLDVALLKRPSRFDRKYHFPLPNLSQRIAYVQHWNERLESSLHIDATTQERLASLMEDFSYAYIKELFVSGMMEWIKHEGQKPMSELLHEQVVSLLYQMTTEDDEE